MAIVSCDHNGGGMGMCPACRREVETFTENDASYATTRAGEQRDRELTEAAAACLRHGLHEPARLIRLALLRR